MILNQQIKKFREAKSLTQEDLAIQMNVARQSISKWEQGVSYPTIDNLVLLSKLLAIPLDTLILGDVAFPMPFAFGKPQTKLRVIIPLFIPMMFLMASLVSLTNSLLYAFVYLGIAVFVFALFTTLSLFDYRRYHNYFVVEQFGLNVDITKGKLPCMKILKGLMGKRKGLFIAYDAIDTIILKIDTHGYAGSKGLNYRPRQYAMLRESISATIVLKDSKTYSLSMDPMFYINTQEYRYFYAIFKYFSEQNIRIIDESHILKSIKNEYDIIEQAYFITQRHQQS